MKLKKQQRPLESDVQKTILEYLAYIGADARRINSGDSLKNYRNARTGYEAIHKIKGAPRGTPDILVCYKGRYLGLEVKRDETEIKAWNNKVNLFIKTAYLNPNCAREIAQYKEGEKIKKAGGIFAVVCNLGQVEEILKNIV